MSLLDDVSIVVTPNGYKAGTLYGVLPVPTEGSEEVIDGNFPAPNTEWSSFGLAAINENIVNFVDAGSNTYSGITQDINSFSAKQYKVEITVTNWISGNILATFSSNNASFNITGNGTYSVYLTPVSTGDDIGLVRDYSSGANFSYSITNVSVKEWTASDMDVTRATAATRVDENGLVNYAEVLSEEYVKNGDFSNGLTDWSFTGASSGFQQDTGSGIKMYSGSVADANNALSTSATLNFAGTLGNMYKMEITASDFINGTTGSIRLDSVYDASNIISFSEGTQTVYFTAYRDFTFIQFFAGTSDATITVNSISIKETDRNNVPRIDYTGGGCPHILAEPQRTNLITYSEDFTQWTTTGTTSVSPNDTISPDGTQNASTVTGLTGSGTNDLIFSTSINPASKTYSFSVYLKGTGTLRLHLSNNVDVGLTEIVTLTSDWKRHLFTGAFNSTSGTLAVVLDDASGATATEYKIWGAQLEEGSYATSYIPNFGTLLGVTRNADIFTRDGIGSLINDSEGVLFVEMAALADDSVSEGISISDGTTNNRVVIFKWNASNTIRGRVTSEGTNTLNQSVTVSDITSFNKIAIKYKLNDFAIWINGVEVFTDNSGAVPIGLNQLYFSSTGGGIGSDFYGKVKQLQVFKTALGGSPYDATLSDARLAALTSL